jgi:membrane dipeptidase
VIEARGEFLSKRPDGARNPAGLSFYGRKAIPPLALLAAFLLMGGESAAGDITLSGTVRDRNRGQAVSSAIVKLIDRTGNTIGSTTTNSQGQWRVTVPVTAVETAGELPRTFSLEQNYPNPFNPSTKLPFTVTTAGRVRVTIHNILGQLVDAREYDLQPGSYAVDWRAKGSAGAHFYSVETNGHRLTKKMMQLDGGNAGGLGSASAATPMAALRLSLPRLLDSCMVITTSLVYETDTTTAALVDSSVVNILLETVHDRAFVVDLHNDVMEVISGSGFTYQLAARHTSNHTDIPRLRDGGVDAQVFSVWISPTVYPATAYFSTAMKFLDTLKAQAVRNSSNLGLVIRSDSAESLARQKRIAGIVVVEGGHCIEDKIENLLAFYSAGVRMMTITWNNSTTWAVSAQDSRADNVGLSELGKQVIRTMDSLGMIIDVSHVGRKTVDDILATSKNPIIASHSGAYNLRGHYRNLTDLQIRAIAQRGGVIGVVFYPSFLTSSATATLDDVIRHIDYIKNLVGVDYIALGSDFDGIERWPVGLEDVTKFPSVTAALLQRGYSRDDVRKILGGNFMRVFRAVCK